MLYMFHSLNDPIFKNFKFIYYFPVDTRINGKFDSRPTLNRPILALKNFKLMFFAGSTDKIFDMCHKITDTINYNDKLNNEPKSIEFYFLEYIKKYHNLFRLLPEPTQIQKSDEVNLDQTGVITTQLSTDLEKLIMQLYILSYAAKVTNKKLILHTVWHQYVSQKIRKCQVDQPYRNSIHRGFLKDNLSVNYNFINISNSIDIRCGVENFFINNAADNYYVPDSHISYFKNLLSITHYGPIKIKPYYGIYISSDNRLEIESFLETLPTETRVDLLYFGEIEKNNLSKSHQYIHFDSMDQLFVNLCYYKQHYASPKFSLNWWSNVLETQTLAINNGKNISNISTDSNHNSVDNSSLCDHTEISPVSKRKMLLRRVKLRRLKQIKNLKKI